MNEDPFKNQPVHSPEQLAVRAEIATEKDLGEIKKIRLEAVGESPKSFDESPADVLKRTDKQWENILFGDKEFVILGKRGTETIGMMKAFRAEHFSYRNEGKLVKNVWCIGWGYLKPEFRRKPAGFAIKGLEECLKEIKCRGGEAAVLIILLENENKEAIIKIGKKFGFKIIKGVLNSDNVFMRLDFSEIK